MVQKLSDEQVVKDLNKASRIFVGIAAHSLLDGKKVQLSIQQYRALALLASEESQRPADLARSLGVTPSTTTALCDRLVEKGLISRRTGTDRRSISLLVTAKGHRQLETIEARRADLLQEILFRLPASTQAQFASSLAAFVDAADDVNVAEWSIRGL